MEIYELNIMEFESESRFLFSHESSSQEKFDKICRELVPIAANLAVKKEQAKDFPSFIGAVQIGEQLELLLINNGFTKIVTRKSKLWSDSIISGPVRIDSELGNVFDLLGNSKDIVLDYNNALSRESLAGD